MRVCAVIRTRRYARESNVVLFNAPARMPGTRICMCVARIGCIFIPVRASQRQQQSADAGLRGPGMAAFDNLIYTT